MVASHAMIGFPNSMRSFDEDAGIIRFSGYDGVKEIRFVLEAPALEQFAKLDRSPDTDYLGAFDSFREQIDAAAVRAYKRTGKPVIRLTIADF